MSRLNLRPKTREGLPVSSDLTDVSPACLLALLGGAIAMGRQLQDGQLEYEDGTPATTSQMAKDVSAFLAFCAEPEHDYRKVPSRPCRINRLRCEKGKMETRWMGSKGA